MPGRERDRPLLATSSFEEIESLLELSPTQPPPVAAASSLGGNGGGPTTNASFDGSPTCTNEGGLGGQNG